MRSPKYHIGKSVVRPLGSVVSVIIPRAFTPRCRQAGEWIGRAGRALGDAGQVAAKLPAVLMFPPVLAPV